MLNRNAKGVKVIVLVLLLTFIFPAISLFAEDVNKSKLQPLDYYYLGSEKAIKSYGGGGVAVGGGAAVLSFGLIGWGVGYFAMDEISVNVPYKYMLDLEPKEQMMFKDGYIDIVKKTRKSMWNLGAGIGAGVAVIGTVLYFSLVMSAASI